MAGRSHPARYPHGGAWPAEMRADMAAAYCDYPTTSALFQAIVAGDAPRPTAWRGSGRQKDRVWLRAALDDYLGRRHGRENANDLPAGVEDIRDLL
jgi:hypothetical protein